MKPMSLRIETDLLDQFSHHARQRRSKIRPMLRKLW